ncbi:MAG: GTP 3',8-cyclase MoaA [Candidatus Omnitrophica bacterium CG11_big_fil_rev_8_21_14_0_20_63_9]|nr:MAG: GTP 3',8-cyclase MoaA [Candidatus Omnitrophica bacterium CG11_big_fil_rev_8_21_14_0_20_63_9]
MLDQFGRQITYLRISVVDKCNLRCMYCMPRGFISRQRMDQLLTNDELVTLSGIFVGLGVRKIRLTGGEPLLRPGLPDVVRRLAAMPGVEQLALSTNGVLLQRHAEALKRAGLDRVNVSLDTLVSERFAAITGTDCWRTVVDGLLEARRVGLTPVKVNMVLMKGINDDEIVPMVEFAATHRLEVRFIEWMPTTTVVDGPRVDRFFSNEQAREAIERAYRLVPEDLDPHAPARRFRVEGTEACVGFISPLSRFFCGMCNRVRLKANGRIKTCLHGAEELDLKTMLREGASVEAIEAIVRRTVFLRPEEHFLNRQDVAHHDFVMTQLGG